MTDTNRMMIDIETFGLGNKAMILELSAVTSRGATFRRYIDPNSQMERNITPSTVLWWLQQSDAARTALIAGVSTAGPLDQALRDFVDFVQREAPQEIWSKGPTFDIAILEHALKAAKQTIPWNYAQIRDYRTVAKMFPLITPHVPSIAHSGLHDAAAQLMHLQEIMNAVKELP